MKCKQICTLLIIFLFFGFSLFSENTEEKIEKQALLEDLFNDNLSADQLTELKKGNEVMTRILSADNLCLKPITQQAKNNIDLVKNLSPSYLMEIIKIIPQKGHENLTQQLNTTLLNIEDYNDIPYFSESHQRWEKLFTKAHFLDNTDLNTKNIIPISLNMDPFGQFTANISVNQISDSLVFVLTILGKKAEVSFINRISTFCRFMFSELE